MPHAVQAPTATHRAATTGDPTCTRSPATLHTHGLTDTHRDHARTVMRGYGARRDIIDVHMRETRKTCGHLLHPQIRTARDRRAERVPSRRRPYLKLEAGAPRVHDPAPQFTRAKPKQRWGLHKAIEGFQIWAGPQIGVGWRPNLGTEAPNLGAGVPKFGLRSAQRSDREAAAWPAAAAACSGRAAAHTPAARTDPPSIETMPRRPPEAHRSSSRPQ